MTNRRKFDRDVLCLAVSHNTSVMGVLRFLNLPIIGAWHAYISNTIKSMGIPWPHYLGTQVGSGGCRKVTVDEILTYDRHKGRRERPSLLRRALLSKGVPYVCDVCGVGSMWQGVPLVLQIDHKNGDPLNNHAENLRFLCPNCHTQTPSYGSSNRHRNFISSCVPEKVDYECQHCQKTFIRPDHSRNPRYCSHKCAQGDREKIEWPLDTDLRELVWSKPLSRLSKEWGVSDTAIRHRCKARGIPVPPRGYWVKKRTPT